MINRKQNPSFDETKATEGFKHNQNLGFGK